MIRRKKFLGFNPRELEIVIKAFTFVRQHPRLQSTGDVVEPALLRESKRSKKGLLKITRPGKGVVSAFWYALLAYQHSLQKPHPTLTQLIKKFESEISRG